MPELLAAIAVKLLRGVGGDREWWWYHEATRIGHFRVGLTAAEYAELPGGCVVADAGESGPERTRTR
jgi:hypothetical protein